MNNYDIKYNALLLFALIASIISGLLHVTVVAFGHVAPLPLETVFFVLVGLLQIVLAVQVLMKGKTLYQLLALGIINGVVAVLWVITRMYRAPFMDTPEEVGVLGSIVFLLEVAAILAMIGWKWLQRAHIHKEYGYSFARLVSVLIAVSLLSGVGIYGGGLAGEIVLPDRTITHGHGEKDGKGGHVDEKPHADEGASKKLDADSEEGIVVEDTHEEDDGHVDEVPHD